MLLSLQVQPLRFLVSVAALKGTLVVLLNNYTKDCVDILLLVVHFPDVLVEVVSNGKLLSTLVTLDLDGLLERCPLLLSHLAKPLVPSYSFDLHPTIRAGGKLPVLHLHVILQGEHRGRAYLTLALLLRVCQAVFF